MKKQKPRQKSAKATSRPATRAYLKKPEKTPQSPQTSAGSSEEEVDSRNPSTELTLMEEQMEHLEKSVLASVTEVISKLIREENLVLDKSLSEKIKQGNDTLMGKIDDLTKRVVEVEEDLNKKIKQVDKDCNKKLDTMLKSTEVAMEGMDNTITEMAKEIKRLKQEQEIIGRELAKMKYKCTDLEARSRRQNLRIIGLKEGKEIGQNFQEFAANLLKQVLKLPEAPRIDMAHRVRRKAQASLTAPPRQIILKFYDISTLEGIMKKIPYGGNLMFGEDKLRFFRDFPAEVMEKRNKFTNTRRLLKEVSGVRYGIVYPAKLRISYNHVERAFTDPEEAFKYAQSITKEAY